MIFEPKTINTTQAKIELHPSALCIDGKIHVFGGKSCNSHFILDSNTNEFNKIADIDEKRDGITCGGSVYVKSKNCVLCFGGYDLGTNKTRLNGVYQYKLSTQKWQTMDVVLPYKMDSFGWILTNDERYIILFGGGIDDHNTWNDDIFLWNLESMVISKSEIKCPQKGLFTAVIMPNDEIFLQRVFDKCCHWKIKVKTLVKDDRMIVDGYLRLCEFGMNLPKEIWDLIYYFYIRITNIP